MTDAEVRIFVASAFGVGCLTGFVMAGLIVHDMVRHSDWNVPGVVFSLLELTLGGACGLIVWAVYHD